MVRWGRAPTTQGHAGDVPRRSGGPAGLAGRGPARAGRAHDGAAPPRCVRAVRDRARGSRVGGDRVVMLHMGRSTATPPRERSSATTSFRVGLGSTRRAVGRNAMKEGAVPLTITRLNSGRAPSWHPLSRPQRPAQELDLSLCVCGTRAGDFAIIAARGSALSSRVCGLLGRAATRRIPRRTKADRRPSPVSGSHDGVTPLKSLRASVRIAQPGHSSAGGTVRSAGRTPAFARDVCTTGVEHGHRSANQ